MKPGAVAAAIENACDELGLPSTTRRMLLARVLRGADPIRARNAALVEAADALCTDCLPSQKAAMLEAAIARFERKLPSIALGRSGELSPHEKALQAAFEAGARMLKSKRRLFDIL